eukprot:2063477-Amphidinium_carterae.1
MAKGRKPSDQGRLTPIKNALQKHIRAPNAIKYSENAKAPVDATILMQARHLLHDLTDHHAFFSEA